MVHPENMGHPPQAACVSENRKEQREQVTCFPPAFGLDCALGNVNAARSIVKFLRLEMQMEK